MASAKIKTVFAKDVEIGDIIVSGTVTPTTSTDVNGNVSALVDIYGEWFTSGTSQDVTWEELGTPSLSFITLYTGNIDSLIP